MTKNVAKKLHISPTLPLPVDTQTATVIVYGGKGMGKTNFGSKLAEVLYAASLRFAVIDPMGVWWGLRHDESGKGPGIKVLILGGIHGDMPIDPTSGSVVADLVVDEDVSVIIDISRHADGQMWSIGERVRFVRDYTKRLYQRQGEKRRPLHQIIDEAARFAPQIIRQGEQHVAECMGAVAVLVEEGRNVGVGVTLLTQRSARLNKDVAELADCMVSFRVLGPNSRRAVLDWLGEHVDKARIKQLDEQLRSIPRGTALVVSPGWLGFEGVVEIYKRSTFDSSATPKAGSKQVRASGAGAKPDLAKYQARMAEVIEQQKANDPKELKKQLADNARRIAELEKQKVPTVGGGGKVVIKDRPAIKAAEMKRIESAIEKGHKLIERWDNTSATAHQSLDDVRGKVDEWFKKLGSDLGNLAGAVVSVARATANANAAVATAPAPAARTGTNGKANGTPPRPHAHEPRPAASYAAAKINTDGGDTSLSRPELRILGALAWLASIGISDPSITAVAFMADYSPTSGGFDNLRGAMRAKGLLEYPNPGYVRLTAEGSLRAPKQDKPASPEQLREKVLANLPNPEQRVLRPLIEAHPNHLDIDRLAEAAGYSAESGGFDNIRGRLRSLGLLTYPGKKQARAADLLFPA